MLETEQRDFLLEIFFKDESFAGWKNIALQLIDGGTCVVAGDTCPWNGGIGNFITVEDADDYFGCVKLKFDVNGFINKENIFFMSGYEYYIESISSKVDFYSHQLNKLEELCK